jgi:MFS transporter, MHS family, proline/betaine transporter
MSKINHINKKNYFVAMIGTALEYYDMSLYGFMAPMLIAQFLPSFDPFTALILTFAAMPLSILSKPLGAIIIGGIGDKMGRKKALTVAIFGISLSTGVIACLPTYHHIGIAAPILFTLCRMMQKFFGAGEHNGAAIYLLEHVRKENRGYISGKYCAYVTLGIILAALMSSIVSYFDLSWRWPYFIGLLTGIFGFYIRANALESPEFIASKDDASLNFKIVKNNLKKCFCIIGMSAFFGCLYTIPAILITSLVPLITNLSAEKVMLINVVTLLIYMICLPISGYFADQIGLRKSMISAAIATIVATLGMIKLLASDSLANILLVKTIFAIISAWYIGPFHAKVQVMFSVNTRYRLVSVSYCIGSQIGGAMPAVSLYLWQKSHNLMLIGGVLIFWAIIGAISCFVVKES